MVKLLMIKRSNKPLNYVYFGFFFLIITILHSYHIFLIDQGEAIGKSFLYLSIIFQSLLEVFCLIMFAHLFENYFPRVLKGCFIVGTMILFILHWIDFFLIRLMSTTVFHVLGIVFNERPDNLVEMLRATHISFLNWGLIGGAIVLVVYAGFGIYRITEKISEKRPLYLNQKTYVLAFGLIPLILISFDHWGIKQLKGLSHREFSQALPLKDAFLKKKHFEIKLDAPLKPYPNERESRKKIKELQSVSLEKKPDIFLFVIESLREDFITPEIAENLSQFREESLVPEYTFSGGNGTQTSWFSIFNSKFPFYFAKSNPKHWKSGSFGIQILKRLGYEIHVFSSSRINYYQMDLRIFGKSKKFANSINLTLPGHGQKPWECDAKTIQSVIKKVAKKEKSGGRCFVVFLESTHFDYSWPEKMEGEFSPYHPQINHLKLAFSKSNLEGIKNRYRNAIHYLDSLFGEFRKTMQKHGQWDNACVIVTGDHGEEFYERGHLFHASNLNWEQIHVPLYFKLASLRLSPEEIGKMGSHLDIFPTILDYLSQGKIHFEEILDGESILNPHKSPYAICGRYNGSRNPYEFIIHDGKNRLLAKFSDHHDIFKTNFLEILEMETEKGSPGLETFQPLLTRFIADR